MSFCWASSLGDCGEEPSKEHFVSAAVFDSDQIDVVGFEWCKDTPKTVSVASLASHILCKKHNNALSPLDQAAADAFGTIRKLSALSSARGKVRQRRWKVRRFEIVDPWLLERWFVKTAINLVAANPSANRWRSTGAPTRQPPYHLVRAAFGLDAIEKPMGLYAAAATGETVAFSDRVEFAPLLYDGPQIMAALFVFRGLRFILHLEPQELPNLLHLPSSTQPEWRTSELVYHIQRLNWKMSGYLSHYVQFLWHLAPTLPQRGA